MKKDVIYIDIEDDITAIIEKVKAASAKIVALVPPKRTGVLQSAVNLKLLQKSAMADSKRVVLITNDQSLVSLAAGVKLPVAKNLQSKPEVPSLPALQAEDNDVINGEELPVGEIAQATGDVPQKMPPTPDTAADEISNHIDLSDKPKSPIAPTKTPDKKAGPFGKVKIPNFNRFRKRFFLIGAAVIVLGSFLVWALVIAPTATITIDAKTSAVNIDRTLNLAPGIEQSKINELQLKPNLQQLKKTASVEFDATGSKEVGEKAKGTITVRNCDYPDGFTLPAGTRFTSASNRVFVSTKSLNVPEFTGPASSCTTTGSSAGKASVAVEALDIGDNYNIAATSYNVTGVSGEVDAVGSAMSGGSRETVTVVSQEDVNKAKDQLESQDVNAAKEELRRQFGNDHIVIEESFQTEAGSPTASPNVGEQAKKAKLTAETTYTLLGLKRDDVKQILSDVLKDALDDKPNQSVFNDGSNDITFQSFQKLADGNFTVRLVTTGYVGTTIDANSLAQQVKGKRYGEIEQIVNQIPGVSKVDITFSPFWVTSAPGNTDNITIRFTVVNDAQ